ncbi:sulfotransferase family protein [Nocardioides terrisoli]|uniref:sulfotransferase family protein n=1 Tax=Nocardioides terrisoli TaxID=3388267 RepID=UPI00287BBCA2|nr:sulfotransferase [Nocardioides marmorisolisilvae]
MDAVVTPTWLVDRAMAATELRDLGDPHFEPVLQAWCDDLTSPLLSDSGRSQLARQAERNLQVRLGVIDTLERHPEIHDVQLPRVVRIMGFPRSGTTLLHNLMARRPGSRSLLRWELVAPVPPPEADTYATDPRIGKVQRGVDALRGSELEHMHWVEATDPEECAWGFFDLSGLMGRSPTDLMSTWTATVFPGRPRRQAYEEYRALVQLLLWHNPLPADGVLVLKCPTDVDQAATFLEAFPEASLVLCHRDPHRIVTSSCHIKDVVQNPWLVDPRDPGRDDRGQAIRIPLVCADAMVDVADAFPDRVVNVRYPDLMADPVAAVVRAYEQLDIAVSPETGEEIRGFVRRQRQGGRATPPPTYGSYGYTAEAVWALPAMHRYVTRFGLSPETERITEPAP